KKKNAMATLTSVPLRSQYGSVRFDSNCKIRDFQEKPVIREYWINAGFFVFQKKAFDYWDGKNLTVHVLPELARLGLLYTNLHDGFWKSMDTAKDQEELERLCNGGQVPWIEKPPVDGEEVSVATVKC